MIWQGALLYDDTTPLAEATPTAITVGERTLRITSDNPARFISLADDTREQFTLRKAGLTVSRYVAECAGRHYTLRRRGRTREIRDGAGALVATTRGMASGDLQVDVLVDAPLVDVVFMTWALTFIDTPARRTLY